MPEVPADVPIIDVVETTDLGGGIDIWDTYEKWRDTYEILREAGEGIWFYTCAFPAGPIMNRSMDLPLTASRAVMWMGVLYRLSGSLHWGSNYILGTTSGTAPAVRIRERSSPPGTPSEI